MDLMQEKKLGFGFTRPPVPDLRHLTIRGYLENVSRIFACGRDSQHESKEGLPCQRC